MQGNGNGKGLQGEGEMTNQEVIDARLKRIIATTEVVLKMFSALEKDVTKQQKARVADLLRSSVCRILDGIETGLNSAIETVVWTREMFVRINKKS